ncbi:MAG TPA: CarD family transcriptional regulator, partial [Burkholderiales bacterium]|nr:CarD family transcriptional regulator [Burkholderiales bacterium]
MQRDPLPGDPRPVGQTGAADALALARIAAKNSPLAVVTATARDAQRLLEEVSWFAPALRLCLLPDWETLPYDAFSPHQDLVSERLATLYRLQRGEFDLAIVPAQTALVRLCPPAYLAARTFFLQQGDRLDAAALRAQLATAGYQHVTQVVAPGEFCIRGGLIDLFPTGSQVPYRLDLDDDRIEAIRTFDVDTQRTLYPVKEIRMLPAREFPLDEPGRVKFRSRWRETFEGDPSKKGVYRDVSAGIAAGGVEYYLPLFFDEAATLFDYLPANTAWARLGDVPAAVDAFWREASSRYRLMGGDPDRPLLPPERVFVPAEEFHVAARALHRVAAESLLETAALPPLAVERRAQDPLAGLKRFLAGSGLRVMVAAESPGRRETMLAYFAEYGLAPEVVADFDAWSSGGVRFGLAVAPLGEGFALPAEGWCVVTEAELYAGTVRRRARGARKESSVEGMLRDLSELRIGDPVVHAQHGIGRYHGLVGLDLGEGPTEFLHLQYEGGDKLYVPVSQL